MRQLATYALETRPPEGQSPDLAAEVLGAVHKWITTKGAVSLDRRTVVLRDGRVATIERTAMRSTRGQVTDIILTEPRPDGWFRTAIAVGESDGVVAVAIGLSAATAAMTPTFVDVRCPRLLRDLLIPPARWAYRGTLLTSSPAEYSAEAGGDAFIDCAWGQARSVPIVAVSDDYGFVLHPGIVEELATDLAGLAVVVRLDSPASWRVTRRKGKEWSCFGGAIRLYWPHLSDTASPRDHPLWTPTRLLASMADTESAAERIRRDLRRRILGQSAFSVSDPPMLSAVRRGARDEELAALRARAIGDADYKSLADEYFEAASRANTTVEQRDAQIEQLQAKIAGLQYALQAKRDDFQEVEPDSEVPPATVEEAVLAAMEQLGDVLVFGSAVSDGVGSLAQDAGPPDKILAYLRALGELTHARRKGELGATAVAWLQDRGVIASVESETIRKSRKEQRARTWDSGNGKQVVFDLHLKPTDGTAPDRCVRIYFAYDEQRQKTVVGWVGRHP